MSKKKIIYGVLGVGALTAIALPIFAGGGYCAGREGHAFGGGHDMKMMSDRMITKLSRKLKLEESQRDALFAAADEVRPEFRSMREQMYQSRREMHDLEPKADNYDQKVAELAKKHAELASKMTVVVAEIKSTLADVLTEEQMAQLKEMREHRRHRLHQDDLG